jgi:glutathione S-transferase
VSLTFYYHPFASFCQKALIGLYELDVPFEKRFIDLAKEEDRAALAALWPVAKFPVLRDEARGITVPEATLILEFLGGKLIPGDSARALECRVQDRFYDNYVQGPMQRVVFDHLRPKDQRDPYGVNEAKAELDRAYDIIDGWMKGREWAVGSEFTMADCAAAPALLYAERITPFGKDRRNLTAYYERLLARPSFARVQEEAQPYWPLFPVRPD